MPIGGGGQVSAYNNAGAADVIFDLAGYVTKTVTASDGLFHPLVPARIMETRGSPFGPSGACYQTGTSTAVTCGALGPGQSLDLQVGGAGGVPGSGAEAAVLNLTEADFSGGTSFLTVYPAGQSRPNASNVNFAGGQTVPNRVAVKLGNSGRVTVYNNSGTADVAIDVNGWYTDATAPIYAHGGFNALPPARVLDTRASSRTGTFTGSGGPGGIVTLTVAGQGGVPATTAGAPATASILNVTVTDTTATSFLTAYPADASRPNASDLNWAPGQTIPNLCEVKLSTAGTVDLYNNAGSTDEVADVEGWYS